MSLRRLEEALQRCGGQEWSVRIDIDPKTDAAPEAAIPSVPAKQREREVMEHPLISRALDVLGARLMKMEEGFGAQSPANETENQAGIPES